MRRGREDRERRRKRTEELQFDREVRGDRVQLDKLIREGHGHCKEADRLRKLIEEGKAK
jgi:hypothetical protein